MLTVRNFAILVMIAVAALLVWVTRHPSPGNEFGVIADQLQTTPTSARPMASELPDGNDPEDRVLDEAIVDACTSSPNAPVGGDPSITPDDNALPRAAALLASSADARHQLAGALLDRKSEHFGQRLQQAADAGLQDAVVLWHAYIMCRAGHYDCVIDDLEQRMLEVDSQNSAVWAQAAARHHESGDDDKALRLLQRAAASSSSRIYWRETLELVYRALEAAADLDTHNRIGNAFGVAASSLPPFGAVSRMCHQASTTRADWAIACLEYGKVSESQSKTVISKSIGLSMQALAHESLQDEQAAADIRSQQEVSRRADPDFETSSAIAAAVFGSETVFFAYLGALITGTEADANQAILERIERLRIDYPGLDCRGGVNAGR